MLENCRECIPHTAEQGRVSCKDICCAPYMHSWFMLTHVQFTSMCLQQIMMHKIRDVAVLQDEDESDEDDEDDEDILEQALLQGGKAAQRE